MDDPRRRRGRARFLPRARCVPHRHLEGEPVPDRICYQAESPDESAFVVAAKRMGFFFKARVTAGVDVDEFPFAPGVAAPANAAPRQRFEVLNILEFNSTGNA